MGVQVKAESVIIIQNLKNTASVMTQSKMDTTH